MLEWLRKKTVLFCLFLGILLTNFELCMSVFMKRKKISKFSWLSRLKNSEEKWRCGIHIFNSRGGRGRMAEKSLCINTVSHCYVHQKKITNRQGERRLENTSIYWLLVNRETIPLCVLKCCSSQDTVILGPH